ncbi:MAG: DNA translocase FtsK 4TM domain-containing protein, partial [Myxococcota bacterium]|nr:DNA translocase FtsK 4TM domain-containing protein [Myxococcota bacterium]
MTLPLFAPRPTSADSSRLAPNTRMPSVLGRGAAAYGRTREVAALVLWTLALFLALALASYQGDSSGVAVGPGAAGHAGQDWVGPVGALCARGLVTLVGVVAWALPLELFVLGIPLVRGKESAATPGRIAGDLLLAIVTAALVQVGSPGRTAFGSHAAAGAVGELFGEVGRSLFSTAGSFLVGFACLGLILIGRAAFSFIALARLVARLARSLAEHAMGVSRAVRSAWREARELEREQHEAARRAREPTIHPTLTELTDDAVVAALPFDLDDGMPGALLEPEPVRKTRARKSSAQGPSGKADRSPDPEPGPLEADEPPGAASDPSASRALPGALPISVEAPSGETPAA